MTDKPKVIKLGPEEDPANIDWIIEAQKKRSREDGVPTDAEMGKAEDDQVAEAVS